MARKKSIVPTPEEQEQLDQSTPSTEVDDTGGPEMSEEQTFAEPGEPGGEELALQDGSVMDAAPDDEVIPPSSPQATDTDAPQDIPAESGPAEESPDDADLGETDPHPAEDAPEHETEPGGYDGLLQELDSTSSEDGPMEDGDQNSGGDALLLTEDEIPSTEAGDEPGNTDSPPPAVKRRSSASDAAVSRQRERVLTIDAKGEVQTEEDRQALIWHEIQNSLRTRRILTGSLDGVEKTESGLTLAVVNYKGFRVAIPVKEMLLEAETEIPKASYAPDYPEYMERLHRILNARLGSEIDFVVKGCDNKTRNVVASRKEAMYRKRQHFYLDANESGEHMIYEGRVVQARVVAVAEKIIRVEVFGVETSIVARGLSWEWIGNARDHFHVGDRILVRVLKIDRSSMMGLSIQADVRSVSATNSHDNLKKCLPQCRYAGKVTDVRNGVVFIRLNNGVNAIAHSCYDPRYPGKNDDVSFAVTRLDEEQGVALGIITRIIKQNL